MTVFCPNGHPSETSDYCDQCGEPIAVAPAQPTELLPVVEEADTSQAALLAPCPVCRTTRSGDDRYCESCGHDFLGPSPSGTRWEAVVRADRDHFDRAHDEGFSFPRQLVERQFALDADQLRIGRTRGAPDRDAPEIQVDDPCVSRTHAILIREADATYAVRDAGSTNGTFLNEDPIALRQGAAVPLTDGDVIRIGVWTTVTIQARR
jgi:hypothetical protein